MVWPARDLPVQDAEELGISADVAAEIVADLRKAITPFKEAAAALTKPESTTVPGDIEVS
ncbi:hypothetical protein ADK43_21860 [Streptomyces rimosus subsp. rimosus]|nr:hypothetical protein ADK43_21860 [Streptomyces rimosus subsp. rimosus]